MKRDCFQLSAVIKPAEATDKEIVWICANCGHVYVGEEAPEKCPVCAHPQAYFQEKADNFQ